MASRKRLQRQPPRRNKRNNFAGIAALQLGSKAEERKYGKHRLNRIKASGRRFCARAAGSAASSGGGREGLDVTEPRGKAHSHRHGQGRYFPPEGGLRLGVIGRRLLGTLLRHQVRHASPRTRPHFRVRRRARLCRSQVVPVSARHDARLRRNADAAGLQFHQSERHAFLRLRFVLFGVATLGKVRLNMLKVLDPAVPVACWSCSVAHNESTLFCPHCSKIQPPRGGDFFSVFGLESPPQPRPGCAGKRISSP